MPHKTKKNLRRLQEIYMSKLKINEIYFSVQGESSFIGLPCIFIRTTGCSLRCSYCDTEYAFYEGAVKTFEEIVTQVKKHSAKLILLTGGEPLDQVESYALLTLLCDMGYTVCLETAGHRDIKTVDPRVHIILDMKTPSSLMMKKNLYENLNHIYKKDEVKFVIGSEDDLKWSVDLVNKYSLTNTTQVIFSPVFGKVTYEWLAKEVLNTSLPIRFQVQLHKIVWDPKTKSV
jgi:7-carboxy-7-deazaguanine synthase